MIIEPKSGFEEHADVCIIGSGAGGAIMAKELSENSSLKIVMLEKGDYFKGEDFDQRPQIRSSIYQDGGARFTMPYSFKNFPSLLDVPVAIIQGKCVGGTTTINEAVCYETPDVILERWENEYGVKGFSKKELRPYIDNVKNFINVHHLSDDKLSESSLVVRKGVEELGYRGENSKQNRKGCVKCGFCHLGCRYDRKQSMLVTAIPAAAANGVKIYSNCNVEVIKTEGNKPQFVRGTVVEKFNDKIINGKFTVHADVIIVAGGAVNSSQLLLKSKINVNKQVGKNMSFQPGVNVMAEFKDKIECYKGTPIGYACLEFSTFNKDTEHGWIMEELGFHPSAFASFVPYTGEAHKEVMSKYRKYSTATLIIQDDPSGWMKIDKQGNPVIKYSLTDSDKNKFKHAVKECCRIYLKAGAKKVITPYTIDEPAVYDENDLGRLDTIDINAGTLSLSSTHIQGGNCMGETPMSVVNSNCEVNGFRNLFVCDASIHPTSLGVNPQLTIMTIASKTADYIKSQMF